VAAAGKIRYYIFGTAHQWKQGEAQGKKITYYVVAAICRNLLLLKIRKSFVVVLF